MTSKELEAIGELLVTDHLHVLRLVFQAKTKKDVPHTGLFFWDMREKKPGDFHKIYSAEEAKWQEAYAVAIAKKVGDGEDKGTERAEELVARLLDEFEEEERKTACAPRPSLSA